MNQLRVPRTQGGSVSSGSQQARSVGGLPAGVPETLPEVLRVLLLRCRWLRRRGSARRSSPCCATGFGDHPGWLSEDASTRVFDDPIVRAGGGSWHGSAACRQLPAAHRGRRSGGLATAVGKTAAPSSLPLSCGSARFLWSRLVLRRGCRQADPAVGARRRLGAVAAGLVMKLRCRSRDSCSPRDCDRRARLIASEFLSRGRVEAPGRSPRRAK